MIDLKGKQALITGAGKGIGRAIAVALAKEGVNLGLLSRTASDLTDVANKLRETYGVRVGMATADISDRLQIERAVGSISNELGPIDILINNAGIGSFGRMTEMAPEEWERIIQVNVLGTYYVTRAVLPSMIKQNQGNIINISSSAGERGAATSTAYSASKFAIMGMTESLMQEVRKNNIRVTALAPSTVNTKLAKNAGLPIGDEEHMMQPEDVAELVIATLKLHPRVFIKTAGLWMTNPQ